ncbi:MAG TPA: HEAT repeat domain-containing protein, partial [Gemmatales bacterium]|nr:HEAT repeat domain-containing protein [Gemmatales bacterium]
VPALLLSAGDTDTYAWVERLTRDDEPAVRVATARAMGQSGDDRLTSLLQKMAEQDVDPTVRELALFYWKQR